MSSVRAPRLAAVRYVGILAVMVGIVGLAVLISRGTDAPGSLALTLGSLVTLGAGVGLCGWYVRKRAESSRRPTHE